jgi:putative endopeptidase
LSAWKSYFRWHTLHGSAKPAQGLLRRELRFLRQDAGRAEGTDAALEAVHAAHRPALGEAVGQDWVKQNFPPAAKASMDKLVAALEKSLGDDIKTLPWMSDATKKAAEEKLAMIRNKIGYPEKWRDYSGAEGRTRTT